MLLAACAPGPEGYGPVMAATFGTARILSAPAPASPPAAPGACADTALMLGMEAAVRMPPMHPAGHERLQRQGFSVLPPGGPDWCVLAGGRGPGRVIFARNTHGGRTASDSADRRHALVATAFLVRNEAGVPFGVPSVTRMLMACEDGPCAGAAARPAPDRVRLGAAECLRDEGITEGAVTARQLRHACIHAEDPRYLVMLVVEESHLPGRPHHVPPLLEAMRGEYRTFLGSLRFESLTGKPPPL